MREPRATSEERQQTVDRSKRARYRMLHART
jgi:hypothetical protein